jgi:hypothetical protein
MTPQMIIARTLKRLYPQNPDVVLGREARAIVAALEDEGYVVVAGHYGSIARRRIYSREPS